jgi:diguanylate cyclase (GGDEF)-like protein/PAS domain S-box-containing protein
MRVPINISAADEAKAIRAEQVRSLYANIPTALVGNALIALILAGMQWSVVPPFLIIVWLALMMFALAARTLLFVAHRRAVRGDDGVWLRRFRISIAVLGAVWGLASLLIFPAHNIPYQAFLTFALGGMTAAAITTLSIDRVSLRAYTLPALAAVIVRLFAEGAAIQAAMAMMSVLFLLLTDMISQRAYRTLCENVILRMSIAKREQELSSLVESSPDNIIRYDLDCRAVYINHRLEATVDVVSESLIGKTPLESKYDGFIGVEDYQAKLQQVINTGEAQEVEVRVSNPNGDQRIHHVRFVAERGGDGGIIGALAFGRDITERKQAEADLRIAAIALESLEAIVITDADQVVLKVNQAFTRITGYTAEEVVGQSAKHLLKSGFQGGQFYQVMWEALSRDKCWQGEILSRRKSGEAYPQWLSIIAASIGGTQLTHYVATFSDISEKKQSEEIIHNLAFYDPLTELPNRRLMRDRLQQALVSSTRNHNHGAILFIDLDNFKELNDTKGHHVGDLLLIEIATRMQASVRGGDTVARLGGDEFLVILDELSAVAEKAVVQAETIAEKIRAAISQPFDLQGHEYHSSSSIGISLFLSHELTVDELLKRADTAMYQAKRSGRNAIRFFDPATHAAMEIRIALETDLRRALPENQLKLYYQMQVNAADSILGAEVLLRWQHSERGLVSPAQFIPLAEETGLIIPIGLWVLETACRQLKAWELDPNFSHLQLSVNVSACQFRQHDFVDQVRTVLAKTAIDPDKLKLELTESLVLDDIKETILKMQALKKAGVHFSLDDFGTGYSSLAYLTQLPLDQLKIDRSFVHNVAVKSSDAVIVQTIIGMAINLGIDVIAEGVETEEQRDFLEGNGCFTYQGYLFGKPVPVEDFEIGLIKKQIGSVGREPIATRLPSLAIVNDGLE